MNDNDLIELQVSLEETTEDLSRVNYVLEELMKITGATWNGKRWIMPLPCQEPIMRELAPEELLRIDDDMCLVVTHFHNLWHTIVMQRGYKAMCLYHGMDKEQVIKAGAENYEHLRSH